MKVVCERVPLCDPPGLESIIFMSKKQVQIVL